MRMRISTSKSEAMVLSRKPMECLLRVIFVPTLTYGHEGWVMTERTRLRVQAAEMGFLRRVTLHRKEPAEVVRASGKDAPRTSP